MRSCELALEDKMKTVNPLKSCSHAPANRRFAFETRREAAGSTKVRQGEATKYQGACE